VRFPRSLDEQKRIVAKLDQAFAALDLSRANAEANLADADELVGQASAKVIEGAAVGGMRSMRLGEATSRLTNGYVGPTRDIYQGGGIPYLLARHVRDGSLRFDGRTYISSEFNQKHKKSMLKQGDVLLVQSGHIGHCAVVPKEHHGHNCHAMIVMTPKEQLVSGKYLSAVFNTPLFQAEFQRIRTGSTVPHLTCGMVRELVVEIPKRAQQDRIVSELEALSADVDVVRSRYAAELRDLASLRQSLLQAAFSGQLT
jgi:type I restriction enzyme S subunit